MEVVVSFFDVKMAARFWPRAKEKKRLDRALPRVHDRRRARPFNFCPMSSKDLRPSGREKVLQQGEQNQSDSRDQDDI